MGSGPEQYCLRWNDFQNTLTSAFNDLRNEENFLDVSLVVGDGQTIKAHQLVLSACSPIFKNMLQNNSHPAPMIFLSGVKYRDISAIINFMYHGQVHVHQEDLNTFLTVAEELRIRGLSQAEQQQFLHSKRSRLSVSDNEDEKRSCDSGKNTSSSVPTNDNSSSHTSSTNPSSSAAAAVNSHGQPSNEHHSPPNVKFEPKEYMENSASNNFDGESSSYYYSPRSSSSSYRGETSALLASGFDKGSINGKVQCPICHKVLKNPHSVSVHISRYHGRRNDTEVMCPVCHRTYGNKYSLRTHMHMNHKNKIHLIGNAKKGTKPVVNLEVQNNQASAAAAAAAAASAVIVQHHQQQQQQSHAYLDHNHLVNSVHNTLF